MIVLVHGVPESAALWDKVRERLPGPTTALALPGFARPRPDGFGATGDDYAAWLVGELEAIGEPVDLVGHDWGAALTYRVATTRGDLLRSWAADVANVMHPRYTWHDFAQLWQTEGAGEEFFASQAGVPAEAHIFANGPHGTGLGKADAALDQWPGLLEIWLRAQGLLTPDKSVIQP